MCGIDIIFVAISVIVLIGLYLILNQLPMLSPFKGIINILIAMFAAIFIIVKILVPLFRCSGV